MNFIDEIGLAELEGMEPVAESDQFAIYAAGADTYLLVQRHNGTPWTALRLSGDGIFRVGSLLIDAMRAPLSRRRIEPVTDRARSNAKRREWNATSPPDRRARCFSTCRLRRLGLR